MIFNFIGGFGSVLQFVAFGYLMFLLKSQKEKLNSSFSPLVKRLFKTVFVLFALKMMMQLVGATPYFANLIAIQLDFAIGYLHWTFLGVVSIAILGFLKHFELIRLSKKGYQLYLIGFVLTEGLIFYKGITQWLNGVIIENYYLYLAVVSFAFFIAITLIFIMQFRKSKTFKKQV